MVYCPYCGNEMAEDHVYCRSCGKKTENVGTASPAPPQVSSGVNLPPPSMPKADITHDLTISLEDVLTGVSKELQFQRKEICKDCKGTGARKGTELSACPECNGNGLVTIAGAHVLLTRQARAPASLGVLISEGTCVNIIQKDAELPAHASRIFSTAVDFQKGVEIAIFQSEVGGSISGYVPVISDIASGAASVLQSEGTSDNVYETSNSVYLGAFTLSGISSAPRGEPQIEVVFHVGTDGILEVTARDLKGGMKHRFIRPLWVRTCNRCAGRGQVITSPCESCQGLGIIQYAWKSRIYIPCGIESGMRLRIPKEGNLMERGGILGDLYIAVNVKPHDILERDGPDLFCSIPIAPTPAISGTEIDVTTLEDIARIRIPPDTKDRTTFRMRGRGLPLLGRRKDRGDLFVRVTIGEIPQAAEAHIVSEKPLSRS